MKSAAYPLLAALLIGLVACAVVPETGRRQLMLVTPAEEQQMGVAAFAEVKAKSTVSQNPQYNAQVERVGKRIAASVGRELPDANWEFVVLKSDEVNAFALPGGKVAVYTGLLQIVKSDDELATVMGHEIAHVTSRHGAERTSQSEVVQGLGQLGVALMDFKNIDPQKQQLILGAYGLGTSVSVLLPFSREQESEADAIGLRFAAQAGYDPRAAITFWQRMSQANAGKGGTPAWLSTHPADAKRIADLQRLAPQYVPVYEAARQRYE